jgi:threonine dehydratase
MTVPAVHMDLIREAEERLRGKVVRTPLINSATLDRRTRGRIFVKAENLQNTRYSRDVWR